MTQKLHGEEKSCEHYQMQETGITKWCAIAVLKMVRVWDAEF